MAFTYGSVVMFNASEGMQKRLLRMCRKYAKNMASEDYSEGVPCHMRPPSTRFCLPARPCIAAALLAGGAWITRLTTNQLGWSHICTTTEHIRQVHDRTLVRAVTVAQ